MNRRDLLAGAAVVAGATVLPRMDFKVRPVRLSTLVVDRRYAESRTFHNSLQGAAARVIDVSDDLCRHWYSGNRAGEETVIAGLTTWIDFVVMRGCAREAGLSVQSTQTVLGRSAAGSAVRLVSWLIAKPGHTLSLE